MELYSIENGIQHLKVIKHSGGSNYPDKLTEIERNALGYYNVFREPNEINNSYYDVSHTEKLIDDVYTISYTQTDKDVGDIRASMLRDLELIANGKFDLATEGYTPSEMSSWNELEANAITHQNTPLTSGMLYDEATVAGITVDELATKVIANATSLKQAKSFISGTRKKISLQIDALTTVDACILFEATPYDYIVTAEDVLADGTLVEGAIIPKLKNNVKEW